MAQQATNLNDYDQISDLNFPLRFNFWEGKWRKTSLGNRVLRMQGYGEENCNEFGFTTQRRYISQLNFGIE